MSVEGICHCGAITVTLDSTPTEVTDCNCSICRRYGVLWAYDSPGNVHFSPREPVTDTYMWDDRSIAFHRCRTCGCVTHWAATDIGLDRMGVNARLLPLDVLSAVRIRHLDGADTENYID